MAQNVTTGADAGPTAEMGKKAASRRKSKASPAAAKKTRSSAKAARPQNGGLDEVSRNPGAKDYVEEGLSWDD